MSNKAHLIKLSVVALAVALLLQPAQAYAGWGRDGGREGHGDRSRHGSAHGRYVAHSYPAIGQVQFSLPHGYISLVLGGSRCFYSDGVYYRRDRQRYVVVAPPPVVVVQSAQVLSPVVPQAVQTAVPGAPDVFAVNIPNNQGGYTAVTIKRSGNGFSGPQGEFYPEFPNLQQLKVMYVK